MKVSFINNYINNFKGFSREIWILAIVTFINRAGTMVLPFLSKYLYEDLKFDESKVGWVLVAFGLGSFVGSYLGGILTDKIGYYKVMVFSLFTSGLFFFVFPLIKSFEALCVAFFFLLLMADMFRPAMFVSIGAYAKPENRTRALTLVRLAVNLGFAVGPAIGGLIIMGIGYDGLFWIDGMTCILAISIFFFAVKERPMKKDSSLNQPKPTKKLSLNFILFLLVIFLSGLTFFQFFTTMPLYHSERYGLLEWQTGLIMASNGFMIFLLEMPLVTYLETKMTNKIKIVVWGMFCMSLGFFVLMADFWIGVLFISTIFLTFGEMFAFPFSNAHALNQAPKGLEGYYMAMYSLSFSAAHIVSGKLGMTIIKNYGYTTNWLLMFVLAMVAVLIGIYVWKNPEKSKA